MYKVKTTGWLHTTETFTFRYFAIEAASFALKKGLTVTITPVNTDKEESK
jgi:hypothetical protein